MPETRDLAYKDRFVRYLIQTLSDRFDDVPEFPTLPFVDRTSRIPLVYRVNQDEYTQILSAIQTGGDLAFPDIAHELELIWSIPDGYEPEEDFCLDYETSDSSIITFAPQDPHTEPDTTPPGYLMPPFWRVGGLIPEFLPDWFADIISDIIDQFTGYEPDDVLTTVGSIPLLANWFELLEDGLPRFTIEVPTSGTVELHLLSVPLGGRLLVSVDIDLDIVDIIDGILTDGFKLIELERDYSSVPPELDVDHIEEIILETNEPHVIYCTFIPVIDLDAIPLKFGGGIRKITWCPDEIPDEECPECPPEPTIPELIVEGDTFETEYLPATFGEYYSETVANEAAKNTAYDSTPQSIAPDAPAAAPNTIEKNALCAAIHRFVKLYASTKLCLIQSKNYLQIMWTRLAAAANELYNAAIAIMSPIYNPNIFSCFVSDAAAITALQNDSAIEELACHIYDELKTVTMSQSNFDAAITDAAAVLTGDAGDIACLMLNDNNLSLYINMLEAYNVTLGQSEAECPCEDPLDYWMLYLDFRGGNRHGTRTILWNGSNNDGFWGGASYEVNKTPVVSTLNVAFGYPDLGADYVVRAAATRSERAGSEGNGTHDFSQFLGYPGENSTGTFNVNLNHNFNTADGTDVELGAINVAITAAIRSFTIRSRVLQATNVTPCELKVHQVVLWGLPDGSGNKPPGAVWAANSLPGTIAGLFP